MKRILVTLLFSVALVGVWFINLNQIQPVNAQGCTVKGKQISASDGTLICDCTTTGSPACNCIVPCKPGDEFEIEEGGSN
jgi:hypothetical protein